MHIFGAFGRMIRVSESKNKMLIRGLNSFSSKTNCSRRRIKYSNLEELGNAVSATKFKL